MLHLSRLHRHSRLAASVVFLAASITGAATAQAASSIDALSVSSGDLVVDKTAAISASGIMDPTATDGAVGVWLQVNPPTLPCLSTGALNDPRKIAADIATFAHGPFRDAQNSWTPKTAGNFLLCAYLDEYWPSTRTFATRQLAVTVRQPSSSLSLALPGSRFEAGETVPAEVTAYAEVEREVDLAINPIGVPCGASVASNQTRQLGTGEPVLGGPTTTSTEITLPSRAGRWRLCGWVGRDEFDGAPTSKAEDVTFWTGPEPSCRVGDAPLSPTGRVRVWCVSVDGTVNLEARRGGRVFHTDVVLSNGSGSVGGRALGLKRGSRIAILVAQDDQQLGSRVLRVRAKR